MAAKTEKKDGISGMFNDISFGSITKFAFQSIFIGLIVGGVFDFTLFHDHPLGAAILEKVREPLLGFYDGVATIMDRPDLMRPTEFVYQGAGSVANNNQNGASSASDTVDSGGVCMNIDPTTMMPVPC